MAPPRAQAGRFRCGKNIRSSLSVVDTGKEARIQQKDSGFLKEI
jgi:hypothetical protein